MGDRLEKLEVAIVALEEAIDALQQLGKHSEADVRCLTDIRGEYVAERDEIEAECDAREHAEQAALEREYWQSR